MLFPNVSALLTVSERKKFCIVVVLSLISALFDIIGLSAIVPIFLLVSKFEDVVSDARYADLYSRLGEPNLELTLSIILMVLLGFFIIKTIFGYITLCYQYNLVFNIRARLGTDLFQKYLQITYKDFKSKNISDLLNMIANEVNIFTGSVVLPCILIATDMTLVIGIGLFLLFKYTTITALLLLIILFSVSCLIYLYRKSLPILGRLRQDKETLRINIAREGFNAFRDLKLLNIQSEFINNYSAAAQECAMAVKNINIIQSLPRFFIELILVFCVVSTIIILQVIDFDGELILPMVVTFIVASSRLLPSFSRITGSMQSVRSAIPSVERLILDFSENITSLDNSNTTAGDQFETLELRNINFSFEKNREKILKNLSLKIEKNRVYGILGESGSGKSTLTEIISGLLAPDSGICFVNGLATSLDDASWQKNIGLVTQSPALFDDTLQANITLGSNKVDQDKLSSSISRAGLSSIGKTPAEGLVYRLGDLGTRLSGGQKQRVGIARALYYDRNVLIFDEPTSALDKQNAKLVRDTIKDISEGKAIIIISHDRELLTICDFLFTLRDGSLVEEQVK